MSKLSSVSGSVRRVGLNEWNPYPGMFAGVDGVAQHTGGQVQRNHLGALGRKPPRRRRGAAADLDDALPVDVAQEAGVGLAQTLRAPPELDLAEKIAVLGLVRIGVGVPPARGWPARSRPRSPRDVSRRVRRFRSSPRAIRYGGPVGRRPGWYFRRV